MEEEKMEKSVHLLPNHLISEKAHTALSHSLPGQELVTWPHLDAEESGKCGPPGQPCPSNTALPRKEKGT